MAGSQLPEPSPAALYTIPQSLYSLQTWSYPGNWSSWFKCQLHWTDHRVECMFQDMWHGFFHPGHQPESSVWDGEADSALHGATLWARAGATNRQGRAWSKPAITKAGPQTAAAMLVVSLRKSELQRKGREVSEASNSQQIYKRCVKSWATIMLSKTENNLEGSISRENCLPSCQTQLLLKRSVLTQFPSPFSFNLCEARRAALLFNPQHFT